MMKILLVSKGLHINHTSFDATYNLKRIDGSYNLLAELLSDKNSIPLIFVKFLGSNKATISQRSDYGDQSILLGYQKLKDRLIAENICKYTKQTVNNNLEFSTSVMLHVGKMQDKINALFLKTDEIFMSKDVNKLPEADVIEEEIDLMRKQMIDDHMDRLNKKECSPQNSGVYVNLVNNLERAADHMIYIAYSVKEAKEQIAH